MHSLVQLGLANALVAALLAPATWFVGRVCRRPALAHGLWVLVLIKLVTPPVWPLAVPLPFANDTPAAPALDALQAPAPPAPADRPAAEPHLVVAKVFPVGERAPGGDGPWVGVWVEVPEPVATESPVEPSTSLTTPVPASSASASDHPGQVLSAAFTGLGWVWLTGTVLWFIGAGVRTYRFVRLLSHGRPAPPELQEQADGRARQMGLGVCPAVWLLPGPLPPLVWPGLGAPRLFFPSELLGRLTADERASLLVHELAHVRRRDHWVRWLEVLVLGLYWWYPVTWWARRQLQAREEECCDAWVVAELPARVYAGAILETIDFLADKRMPLATAIGGLGGFDLLRQRLTLIMERRTPKRMSYAGWLLLAVAGAALLPLGPRVEGTENTGTETVPVPRTAAPPPAPPAEKSMSRWQGRVIAIAGAPKRLVTVFPKAVVGQDRTDLGVPARTFAFLPPEAKLLAERVAWRIRSWNEIEPLRQHWVERPGAWHRVRVVGVYRFDRLPFAEGRRRANVMLPGLGRDGARVDALFTAWRLDVQPTWWFGFAALPASPEIELRPGRPVENGGPG